MNELMELLLSGWRVDSWHFALAPPGNIELFLTKGAHGETWLEWAA